MLHARMHAIEGRLQRPHRETPRRHQLGEDDPLLRVDEGDDVLLDPHPRRGPEEHEQGDARHQGGQDDGEVDDGVEQGMEREAVAAESVARRNTDEDRDDRGRGRGHCGQLDREPGLGPATAHERLAQRGDVKAQRDGDEDGDDPTDQQQQP